MSLLQTRLRWQQIERSNRPATLKVAVLASFTAEPLAPYLGVALEDAGLPALIHTGPYNQIVQECIAPGSETADFAPDVLLVWPRLEELWSGRPLPLSDDPATYADAALETADAAIKAARDWKATLLFVLPALPEARPLGVGDAGNINGVIATATIVRETLRRSLANKPGVLLADMEEVVRSVGGAKAYNVRLMTAARIPFTEETFSLTGQRLARLLSLSRSSARKVLVVDGDNTLWGGVVGEEGAAGVDLKDNGPGEAFRNFQSYLLELRRAGVLIGVSSKNNEADFWEVFTRREMVLSRDHIAAYRINWQPKSVALREIADELNLGVSSFVFVDDSQVELGEVAAALPEVGLIRMPEDPANWLSAIQDTGLLDRLPPTAEDMVRAEQYQQERQRTELKQNLSPDEYLAGLDVRVHIFPPTPADMSRLAQLVAKTNQFNLNLKRRSEAELAALSTDPHWLIRLVAAQDRFGDYGTIGLIIVDTADPATLDTFLLSCRAMSRGVEDAMVAAAFEAVDGRDVLATVADAPKNEPAKRFFAKLGSETWGTTFKLHRVAWPSHVTRV